MSRKSDIEALLNRAEKNLIQIEIKHQKALEVKEISDDLKIDIKNFFENLRSALDYIARDLVEKYCQTADPNSNLYFPIRKNKNEFDNLMNKSFPNLSVNCRAAYDILESLQPFMSSDNTWLFNFNKITNEYKHQRLIPQKRIEEIKRITAHANGKGDVSWNPSSVSFGPNVFIHGIPIDQKTQMPVPSDSQTITKEIWVDFQFEGIGVSSIELIKESLSMTKKIYSDLKDKI